jgi:MFS transporter, SP family, sugar:H+ symporter
MFPGRYRAKGMALSTASNWLWNFLIAFFTPFITKAIDFRYGYVFAGCNAAAVFIVYFFVMEGQGRTLEELDTMFIERVSPRKSSKWVAPSKEEMSRLRKEAGTEMVANGNDRGVSGDTERAEGDNLNQKTEVNDLNNPQHEERV